MDIFQKRPKYILKMQLFCKTGAENYIMIKTLLKLSHSGNDIWKEDVPIYFKSISLSYYIQGSLI